MDSLVKIFQSGNGEIRLKILRYFLTNSSKYYSITEVEEETKSRRDILRKDLLFLANAEFLERALDNRNASIYKLNPNFLHKEALYNLVFDFKNLDQKFLLDKFKKLGKIKFFVCTGVFTDEQDVDIDILVVVDKVKEKEKEKIVSDLNNLYASKLRVLIMDAAEFNYRKKMYDRYLHLILDSRINVLIDKLGEKF